MNREPKFRYNCNGEMRHFTLYELMYGYVEKNINHPEDYRGEWCGLTKNSKEIYEGDIIIIKEALFSGYEENPNTFSTQPNEKMEDLRCVVRFEDTAFWVNEFPLYAFTENDMEVIGNIYENPEIL